MHRCKKKKETPAAFDRDAPSSFPNKNERITLHAIRILHFRLRELRRRERREKRGRKKHTDEKRKRTKRKKEREEKNKTRREKRNNCTELLLAPPIPLPLPLRICAHPASSWMEREKEKKRKEYRVGASDKRAVRRRSVIFSRKERICSIGGRITVAALI